VSFGARESTNILRASLAACSFPPYPIDSDVSSKKNKFFGIGSNPDGRKTCSKQPDDAPSEEE